MGIGPWHLILIVLIVLIFFGPSRLPSLGRSVGEAIRGFKKGLSGETELSARQEKDVLPPYDEKRG